MNFGHPPSDPRKWPLFRDASNGSHLGVPRIDQQIMQMYFLLSILGSILGLSGNPSLAPQEGVIFWWMSQLICIFWLFLPPRRHQLSCHFVIHFIIFGNFWKHFWPTLQKHEKMQKRPFQLRHPQHFEPSEASKMYQKVSKIEKIYEFWMQHFPPFWRHFGTPGGSVFEGCLMRNACF